MRRPLIERELPAWERLLSVHDVVEMLRIVKEHRDQIAHITESGSYTNAQCGDFLRRIRNSGWMIEFLAAMQPVS
jgi:hypothetical protein